MGYMTHGNENSLPMRVKSQCALLRANIDEFEKSKRTPGNAAPAPSIDRFPAQSNRAVTNKSMISDERDVQLQFYRSLVAEVDSDPRSASPANPQAMQQD